MTNPRKQNGHRWRQLRTRVLATETHCWLCENEVDKTLPHLDPMAPEIDHKVPVSRGGPPYARWNARLSHRICNQRRGNRPAHQPRAASVKPLTSRRW